MCVLCIWVVVTLYAGEVSCVDSVAVFLEIELAEDDMKIRICICRKRGIIICICVYVVLWWCKRCGALTVALASLVKELEKDDIHMYMYVYKY